MLTENAPQEFISAADEANAIKRALQDFAERENLSMQACMGLSDFPWRRSSCTYRLNRVPETVDDFVKAAYQSAIEIGGLN